MAKEWILNQAMNRWGLNKKRNVGPVSELIRTCHPKTVEEWEQFYYANVYPAEHLEELGNKLYIKISEIVQYEIASISEENCRDYIKDVVIRRTFEGYRTEIETIYGQIENRLGVAIKPAPDEWDRLYNVDFFIEVGQQYIGLQIKPITFANAPAQYKWRDIQSETHRHFQAKHGGQVFTVFSARKGRSKVIVNEDVIPNIQQEIARLRSHERE